MAFNDTGLDTSYDFVNGPISVIKSHFPNNFVWTEIPEDSEAFQAFVVIIKNETNNYKYNDVVVVSEIDEDGISEVFGKSISIPIYLSSNTKSFGSGPNQYRVAVNIRDKYSVIINASSKDEAISISESIPVYEWHHENIEPGKPTRQVTMFAKWWNYEVEAL